MNWNFESMDSPNAEIDTALINGYQQENMLDHAVEEAMEGFLCDVEAYIEKENENVDTGEENDNEEENDQEDVEFEEYNEPTPSNSGQNIENDDTFTEEASKYEDGDTSEIEFDNTGSDEDIKYNNTDSNDESGNANVGTNHELEEANVGKDNEVYLDVPIFPENGNNGVTARGQILQICSKLFFIGLYGYSKIRHNMCSPFFYIIYDSRFASVISPVVLRKLKTESGRFKMALVSQKRGRGNNSGEASAASTNQLSTLNTAPGTLTDELAALFECPVCFEVVLPPIMQCQVGHLVCASCRPKLSCCPTCRGTLGNIRNLAMEKVANNLMFPCKHKSTGCRMSLGLNEKAEHEEICEFRPYSCPCPGASCSWQGQLDKVMVHLQHAHKNITTLNGEDIVFLATEINLAGAVDWVMMQSCFGHHFMLVLEKQEKSDGHTQFFAIVQLIGSRKQAEHFAYRLELNGNRRRLIWEAMPRSSHEGVASAIMGSDCLVFDNSIAQHFADNGNLGINVTISLVC